MMEGDLYYVDHNELIDIRVSVLIEPAVGERHLFSVPLCNSTLGWEYQDPFHWKVLCSLHCIVCDQYFLYCIRSVWLVE